MIKDQNRAPVGPPRFDPEEHLCSPSPSGNGWGRGFMAQISIFEYFFWNAQRAVFTRRSHGMDAAASRTVTGTESAGNAKGVLYDN